MDEAEIVRIFERRGAAALFVTELRHALGPACPASALDAALARLAERGEILLVAHPVPDPHLAGADLRIAAPVTSGADPLSAAETLWNGWLREFLASHRCS